MGVYVSLSKIEQIFFVNPILLSCKWGNLLSWENSKDCGYHHSNIYQILAYCAMKEVVQPIKALTINRECNHEILPKD